MASAGCNSQHRGTTNMKNTGSISRSVARQGLMKLEDLNAWLGAKADVHALMEAAVPSLPRGWVWLPRPLCCPASFQTSNMTLHSGAFRACTTKPTSVCKTTDRYSAARRQHGTPPESRQKKSLVRSTAPHDQTRRPTPTLLLKSQTRRHPLSLSMARQPAQHQPSVDCVRREQQAGAISAVGIVQCSAKASSKRGLDEDDEDERVS